MLLEMSTKMRCQWVFVKSYLHAANVLRDCANEILQKLSRVVPLLLHAQLNASFPLSEIFVKTFGCYLFPKAYECLDSVNGATYFNLGKFDEKVCFL